MLRPTSFFSLTMVVIVISLTLLSAPLPVQAGCGCQKTPPAPAVIFPNATYSGMPVTLVHSALQSGQTYTVTFTAMNGQSATASAQAVSKRDLSDGQYKPQLSVSLPVLPLGPTSITIQASTGSLVTTLDDTLLTVVPSPVVVPAQLGDYHFQGFKAAVGRDGTVYLSLDMTQVQLPMVFQAQAKGYSLRFSNTDVVFYNTQGFLMQTLTQGIPGLFTIQAPSTSADSDTLRYSRHEFATYYLQHGERQTHQLDPTDANWHQDGTRHVDHNHLVLALAGHLSNGSLPSPGATPAFELVLTTSSLFSNGLVGTSSLVMTDVALINSYNSQTGAKNTAHGDILSNGSITLKKNPVVYGDARGLTFSVSPTAWISGTKTVTTQATQFLSVAIPTGIPNLGALSLVGNTATRTLTGPASYKLSSLTITDNGRLVIDNSQGPVTLYITGPVNLARNGSITTTDPNPEKFAIYVSTNNQVSLEGNSSFYGVLYAPYSPVTLLGRGTFYGAFIGSAITVQGQAFISYDTALRGN